MLQPNYPAHWLKGQLLDVKRFSNGMFTVANAYDQAKEPEHLRFDSTESCQAFVSWWYGPEQRQ